MYKALIFDMDGVLADTIAVNQQSYDEVVKKYGITITPDVRKQYLGSSLKDKYEGWQEHFNVKFEESFEEFMAACSAAQKKLLKEKLEPDPQLIEYLKTIRAEGVKIAVATSSTKERAINILARVDVWALIDVFVCAEDVEKHKPAPDLFLEAARRLEEKPDECIVIEDAVNGVQAAKAAGMRAIAKTSTYHTKEEFEEADGIIEELSQIEDVLKQF